MIEPRWCSSANQTQATRRGAIGAATKTTWSRPRGSRKNRAGRISATTDHDHRMEQNDPFDDSIVVASALNVITGTWVIFSPLLLSYPISEPRASTIMTGVVVALLAYLRADRAARSPLLSWANAVAGTWLVASGLWLRDNPVSSVNEVVAGGMIVIFALTSALIARE